LLVSTAKLPANSIRNVITDKDNNVWLAMSEIVNQGCIVKISGEVWTIYTTSDIGFNPYYFGNLAVDTNNKLYASIDYSLSSFWDMSRPNIIEYDGTTWSINNPVDEYNESLGYVGSINTDLSGNLWAVMHGRKGVHLAVFNGDKWYYNNAEIPLSWGSEIVVDQDNDIWLSTGQGIYIIEQ